MKSTATSGTELIVPYILTAVTEIGCTDYAVNFGLTVLTTMDYYV